MPHNALPVIHLHAGELFIGSSLVAVNTVLGSCVSVTMHHPGRGIGLICHGIMPVCPCGDGNQCRRSASSECFRFVNCSVHFMVGYLARNDIPRQQVVVKLFGGSEMFGDLERGRSSIGKTNVEVALASLKKYGMAPSVTHVGGTRGRRLQFLPHTGEVWMKRLRATVILPPVETSPLRLSSESPL